MNVTSNSQWTLTQVPSFPAEAGVNPLTQFASTKIPLISSPSAITSMDQLKSALQTNNLVRRIDLCPQIGPDQTGELTITPFKEIPKFVKAGDIVTFIATNASPNWTQTNAAEMLKQRGWHAEIVVPKQGKLVLHGPWGGDGVVSTAPVEDVTLHPHYGAGDWNLHFSRFYPPNQADQGRFSSLMAGLEGWSAILPQTSWPSDMVFNPLNFSDVTSLLALGDKLIQKQTPPPTMFCIEWVNAIFCLSCCYPLTKKFLSSRGLLSNFAANFGQVPLLDDSLEPFSTLPWAAYKQTYIVESFAETYFDEDMSDIMAETLLALASYPSHDVIMPSAPILETRRKSNQNNFGASYVCTAVDNNWCIPKTPGP